eukprot:sb/3475415/
MERSARELPCRSFFLTAMQILNFRFQGDYIVLMFSADLQMPNKNLQTSGILEGFRFEPTNTSKQPIRTRYLGHMTGYQLIRDQYFLGDLFSHTRFAYYIKSHSPRVYLSLSFSLSLSLTLHLYYIII